MMCTKGTVTDDVHKGDREKRDVAWAKPQALVYDVPPPTTAVTDGTIDLLHHRQHVIVWLLSDCSN